MSSQTRHVSLKPKKKINIISVRLIFSSFCLLFQDTSLTIYDVNKMEQSRKTYDRGKLYFEMTFSLTSPSEVIQVPNVGGGPETGENNLVPRVLSLLQEVEKGPWERG